MSFMDCAATNAQIMTKGACTWSHEGDDYPPSHDQYHGAKASFSTQHACHVVTVTFLGPLLVTGMRTSTCVQEGLNADTLHVGCQGG